jgi:protein TonB
MTPALRMALGASLAAHATLLIGLPMTGPVAFDVERARTSVELYLIAPAAPRQTTQAEPVSREEPPVVQPPVEPATQTFVSEESRGALTEALPSYLRNPAPVYPRLARERGQEGTVVLEVEVLASGRAGTVRVLRASGHELLDQAALQAVRGWVFRPARRWQQPVPFVVEIPVTFRLVESRE